MCGESGCSLSALVVQLSDALAKMEEEGMLSLRCNVTACSGLTFEQMAQREMKFLDNG
jgi:hypothetical protein